MDTSRIEKFLAGLADSNLPNSQQAMIFTCEDSAYGEENSKTCRNAMAPACADNRGVCVNAAGSCNDSSNSGDCSNSGDVSNGGVVGGCLKPPPDNGSTCQVVIINGISC